jgi:uncharacterized protein involved in exopolysaccharide biosynthesis
MVDSRSEVNQPSAVPRQGFSMRDIVFTVYRRKWIILAIALPIILVGSFSLLRQTGSYTASARILVELNEVDQPRWNIKTGNIDYDRELSTLFNIAMSVPVIRSAAISLEDSIPAILELNPELISLREPGEMEGFLFERMDVSVVGESSILEFQFSSASPRISLMAVGALRDAFIEYYTYRRRDGAAIDYYTEQIALVRAEMDSFLLLRTKAMEEAGFTSLNDELRFNSGQLASLQAELYTAVADSRTLELEYNRLKTFLDRDPREFPMGSEESRSQALVYWRNIVSKHEDELNNLKAVHTANSIPVQRQQEMLERSLANLAQHVQNYVESLNLQLLKAREKESSIRDMVEEVREKNRRGPLAYQRVSSIDTEIESLRELLQDLQGKRGEVRLSEMADERISNLANLSDPEIMEVISGSKTVIYLALLVIFALALGLVAAFVMQAMDHRVFAPEDVEENLKLPVFASISRTD